VTSESGGDEEYRVVRGKVKNGEKYFWEKRPNIVEKGKKNCQDFEY
jgi:hypothetical protein